jgi:hypothetical protein
LQAAGTLQRRATSSVLTKPSLGVLANLSTGGEAALSAAVAEGVSELEATYASEARQRDALQDLVAFPPDDLVLESAPKRHRTEASARAGLTEEELVSLDPAVREALNLFSSDWRWITHRYARYERAAGDSIHSLPLELFEEDAQAALSSQNAPARGRSSTAGASSSSISRPSKELLAAAAAAAAAGTATPPSRARHSSAGSYGSGSGSVSGAESGSDTEGMRSASASGGGSGSSVQNALQAALGGREVGEQEIVSGPADQLRPEWLQILDPSELRGSPTRQRTRLPVFRYYCPDYEWENVEQTVCLRRFERVDPNVYLVPRAIREKRERERSPMAGLLPEERQPTWLLVQVRSFTLPWVLEPFFASLALYDFSFDPPRKLSENFYFDFNSEEMRRLLVKPGEAPPGEEYLTSAKRCVFQVSNPSDHVYMILRVEKVFQGDAEEVLEPYVKHEKEKPKEVEKNQRRVQEATRLFQYFGTSRQTFAWSFTQLFTANGQLRGLQSPVFAQLYPLSHKHEDPLEVIQELRDPKGKGKLPKPLVGSCDLRVARIDRPLPGTYDPSLQPLCLPESELMAPPPGFEPEPLPFAAAAASSSSSSSSPSPPQAIVREVQEFPLPNIRVTDPYQSYLNLMYVYPLHVNLGSVKNAKNILVRCQFRDTDDDPEQAGLPVFFGPSGGPAFLRSARSAVTYHEKSPSFQDEFKLRLPPRLTSRHHLLFSFYHLNLEAFEKKKADPNEIQVETLLGYAVLPLWQQPPRIVPNGEHALPVVLAGPGAPAAAARLEKGYLNRLANDTARQAFTYADGGKPVFRVRLETLSTVFPQDATLASLCNVYHFKEFFMDEELKEVLNAFGSIPPATALLHLPQICVQLLTIMGIRSNQPGLQAFKALVIALHKVQQLDRPSASGHLEQCRPPRSSPLYVLVDYVLDNVRGVREPVYRAVCANFLMFLMEKKMGQHDDVSIEDVWSVCWWLFEVVIRSMSLRLVSGGPDADPTIRYDLVFIRLVKKLVSAIAKALRSPRQTPVLIGPQGLLTPASAAGASPQSSQPTLQPLGSVPATTSSAAASAPFSSSSSGAGGQDDSALASSAAQAAATGQGGAMGGTGPSSSSGTLGPSAGAAALGAVGAGSSGAPSSQDERLLTDVNRNVALFVRDLLYVMDRGNVVETAANYVAELEAEGQPGQQQQQQQQQQGQPAALLAQWKYEFLRILLDHEHLVPLNCPLAFSLSELAHVPRHEVAQALGRRHQMAHLLMRTVLGDLKRRAKCSGLAVRVLNSVLCKHDYDARYQDPARRERVALIYFGLVPMLVDNWQALQGWREQTGPDAEEERRALYVCLLYLIKNSKAQIEAWWRAEPEARLLTFLDVLAACIDAFEFNPSQQLQRPLPYKRTAQLHEEAAAAAGASSGSFIAGGSGTAEDRQRQRNARLSSEASLLVLDLLEDLMYTSGRFLPEVRPDVPLQAAQQSELADKVFSLLVRFLRRRQSEWFLDCFYESLRCFTWYFRHQLFRNGQWCIDLLKEVLRHCSFTSSRIREQATAYLYTFMRQGYLALGTFGRLAIQATTAISLLGSEQLLTRDDTYLRRALASLAKYSLHEYGAPSDVLIDRGRPTAFSTALFARWVQGLAIMLTKTARDTIQVSEWSQKASDPEMIADLYYRIAQGYTHIPDLRISWLEKLTQFHDRNGHSVEAGMCCIQIAAIIWSYLQWSSPEYRQDPGISQISSILNMLTPGFVAHTLDWSLLQDEVASSPHFCEKAFITTLKKAILQLKQAEFFEFANELYKVLVPLYERSDSYRDLSQAHAQLQQFFQTLWSTSEQRYLGTYFRVGFFGAAWGEELNGKEFVYREKQLTHLLDISERLKTMYSAKHGPNFQLIADSRVVDRSTLDPAKAYLQITHLEPYFPPEELKKRRNIFRRNTDLREFVFVTPFTMSGKAHGALHEQYKRKTILTVEHSFPFVLKRLPVVAKREEVLSPIENAIEDITNRTLQIQVELERQPPILKAIQSLLQGSVRLQVNAGSVEVARVFLGPSRKEYPAQHVQVLERRMMEFLKACEALVRLNRTLIDHNDPTQLAFQEEMQNGFNEISREIDSVLHPPQLCSAMEALQATLSMPIIEPTVDHPPGSSSSSSSSSSTTQARARDAAPLGRHDLNQTRKHADSPAPSVRSEESYEDETSRRVRDRKRELSTRTPKRDSPGTAHEPRK